MRIPALTYGKLYDTRNLQNTAHAPAIKFLNQLSTDSVSFGSSERQLTNQEVIQNFKKYFRTKACEEKDGTIRIKSYTPTKRQIEIFYRTSGLTEEQLFENVSQATGNITLKHSKLTSLYNIKTIGGDLNIDGSQLTDLGELVSVGRNAWIAGSKLNNRCYLDYVGEDLTIDLGQYDAFKNVYADGYLCCPK